MVLVCFSFLQILISSNLSDYLDFLKTSAGEKGADFSIRHWDSELGYLNTENEKSSEDFVYPHRAIDSTIRIEFRLDPIYFEHKPCIDDQSFGVTVALHQPEELPNLWRNSISLRTSKRAHIRVEPEVILTSEDLRPLDAMERQCYFKGDRELKFFQHYTQENCELECLSNYTIEKCQCAHYAAPRELSYLFYESAWFQIQLFAGENGFPICGQMTVQECFDEKGPFKFERTRDCKCFPSCVATKFKMEVERDDYSGTSQVDGLVTSNHSYLFFCEKFTVSARSS